jgi:hypothetical protein
LNVRRITQVECYPVTSAENGSMQVCKDDPHRPQPEVADAPCSHHEGPVQSRASKDHKAHKKTREDEGIRPTNRRRIMVFVEICVLYAIMFGIGFASGYGARARISRQRRDRARERFMYPA